MTIICQSLRLTIRELNENDVEFIIKLLNEPSFVENITDKGVRSVDDAINYLNSGPIKSYHDHDFGLYMVELTASNKAIGMCGILKRPELPIPDLGYALLPEFCGKGYAKEAAKAVLDDANQRLNVAKIAAVVNFDNDSSIHLLKRLGFRQLKTMTLYQGEPECLYFEFEPNPE